MTRACDLLVSFFQRLPPDIVTAPDEDEIVEPETGYALGEANLVHVGHDPRLILDPTPGRRPWQDDLPAFFRMWAKEVKQAAREMGVPLDENGFGPDYPDDE